MLLYLPSKGVFGQRSVNLEFPTFGVLKALQTYSSDEVSLKSKLAKEVTDVNLAKVSWDDVEYIFSITAFSLLYNCIKYNVTCPECKTKFKANLQIVDLDIKQLDSPYKESKEFKGTKYTYNVLTAQQVVDAWDLAQYEEDVDEAFLDAKTALILGRPISQFRDIKQAIPTRVYVGAHIFTKMKYHGLSYLAKAVCPSCGKEMTYRYNIPVDVLKIDVEDLLDKYYDISSYMSMSDFWNMTLLDYNTFVQIVNRKLRHEQG